MFWGLDYSLFISEKSKFILSTIGPVVLHLFLVTFSVGMTIEIFFRTSLEVTILAVVRLVVYLQIVSTG